MASQIWGTLLDRQWFLERQEHFLAIDPGVLECIRSVSAAFHLHLDVSTPQGRTVHTLLDYGRSISVAVLC